MTSLENDFRSHPIRRSLHRFGTIYSSLGKAKQSKVFRVVKKKEATYWMTKEREREKPNHTSSTTFLEAPKSASLMHPLLSTKILAPCRRSYFKQTTGPLITYVGEKQKKAPWYLYAWSHSCEDTPDQPKVALCTLLLPYSWKKIKISTTFNPLWKAQHPNFTYRFRKRPKLLQQRWNRTTGNKLHQDIQRITLPYSTQVSL